MSDCELDQIVLDAFRVEHREQVEQIRALLDSMAHDREVASTEKQERLAEAFRLAHSFKGGARVCDLREAEQLGHGLESVLERVSRGGIPLSENVIATANLLLDTIEDWMAALESGQTPPDTSTALAAIDDVLNADSSPPCAHDPSGQRSLRDVFRTEYEQHASQIRQHVALWSDGECESDQVQLAESIRAAHTLAGAAAVVQMPVVQSAMHSLEERLRSLQKGDSHFDNDTQRQIEDWLKTADASVAALGLPDDPSPATSEPRQQAAAVPASHDSVRVNIDSLERLTGFSSQMLADLERIGHFSKRLEEFHDDVRGLEHARDSLRRSAAANRSLFASESRFESFAETFEQLDRQLSKLSRQALRLSVENRRTDWILRRRAANIFRSVQDARLVPAHSVFHTFRKMIRDLARSEQKQIDFVMNGLEVRADRLVLQELKNPLLHILRNCVTHGIERPEERLARKKPARGRVELNLEIVDGRLSIVVLDDGRGFDLERIQSRAVRNGLTTSHKFAQRSDQENLSLLFEAGFSTLDKATELAGRGMGLSIVQNSVARLQGHVYLEQRNAGGVCVTMSVPCAVSTHRVLLVSCGGQVFALPARHINRLLRVPADSLESIEGHPVVSHDRCPVRLQSLATTLGIRQPSGCSAAKHAVYVVLLEVDDGLIAVSVDALIEERDAMIQPLDPFADSRQFAGCILLDAGRIALVVQPNQLNQAPEPTPASPAASGKHSSLASAPSKILIVDDSFTTRTLEKNILEAHGYRVGVAVDGVEALTQLRQQKFAAVVSDVEMPRMDGFTLLEQIKSDRHLAGTPVILVTSRDRQEDQRRGLDLGAEAYIVKRKFDHQELLSTIRQFVLPQQERSLEWTSSA